MPGGDAVQKIKERLSIVDVVSPYVELHKAGKNYKGKSPFTNEKTPSFYVSPDRGMYYCFSSSQGGDAFTFIQAMEGVDFKGALKILAEKAGVELVPEDPRKRTERDRQYDALEAATRFFERKLLENTEALEYLSKRGVSGETRARWRVGYAPGPPQHGWRELKSHLEELKFTKEELLRAGLIKGQDTGKEPYDVFRDRVMFPIFDASGRVVAFSGRILTAGSDAPKYVNSPETELFVKSDILYGYDKAKEGIRKLNFSLIVEGQFDVVLAHQAGYGNTVAVSGTALTPHHVELLQRLSSRVVLALDDDRAGIAAVKRAAELMLARGMDVKVVKLRDGQDPADMIREDVDSFRDAVRKAVPVVEFLLLTTKNKSKDERSFKLLVREEVLPYVARIPNAIDREHFEALIAQHGVASKEAIHAEVTKLMERSAANTVQAERERVVASPVVTESAVNSGDASAISIFGALAFLERFPEGKDIVKELHSIIRMHLGEEYETISGEMSDEQLNPVIIEFESTYESFPGKAFFENFVNRLNRFHERSIKRRLAEQRKILDAHDEATDTYEMAKNKAHKLGQLLASHQVTVDQILPKKD